MYSAINCNDRCYHTIKINCISGYRVESQANEVIIAPVSCVKQYRPENSVDSFFLLMLFGSLLEVKLSMLFHIQTEAR